MSDSTQGENQVQEAGGGNPAGERESDTPILDALTDLAVDTISGLPAVLRKVAADTIGKLASKAADLGGTYLDTLGEERRAASAQRIRVLEEVGSQLVAQVNVHGIQAEAATTKALRKIVGKQLNVDQTCLIAVEELAKLRLPAPAVEEATSEPVSDDWINAFSDEAGNATSETMRRHFGRILAGEIQRPGAFSIRTLRVMSQLDNRAAELFTTFCSLSISLRGPDNLRDVRVAILGDMPKANGLRSYGLPFDALNVLEEYGLIIPEFASQIPYNAAIVLDRRYGAWFEHQGRKYALKPSSAEAAAQPFMLNGVAASKAGTELSAIVDPVPNPEFTADLTKYFERHGFSLLIVDPTQKAQ